MLKEFELWLSKNTDYSFTHNENELSDSVVIDIENDRYIARFTLWDDLSCISEIIDINTSHYTLNKRNEFSTFNELLSIFKVFSECTDTAFT